ncbi:putative Spectrin alpha chain [Operophtera brumata]|uniref:Putative Spectrin alpha chain n=1 Tax=Operophtera brumata TaxID=104452 RepID=A0A0L7KUI8_OPEBR|nr:putative Spectrin alpha chain [Operophtera brumata]
MSTGLVEGGGERPARLCAGRLREEDRRRPLLLAAEPRRLQSMVSMTTCWAWRANDRTSSTRPSRRTCLYAKPPSCTRDARPSTRRGRGPGTSGGDAEEVRRLPKRPSRERSASRRDERDRSPTDDGPLLINGSGDAVNNLARCFVGVQELNSKWKSLQQLTEERASQLGSAHEVQRFHRDLDETANRLMSTHGDSAEATYSKQREITDAWQQLQTRANARKEKLLDSYDLQRAWVDRRMKLDQNLELQLFYRDCEQAEGWMAAREAFLAPADQADNPDQAQPDNEEKIAQLQTLADQLIASDHYAASPIDKKRRQTLQQFSRDADEMENWIAEKLQLATEESYKDPANIQSKHQKHQAFEAELAANAERIQSVLAMGGNLVQRGQCSGSEDAVQDLASVQNLMKKHQLVEADIQAHEDRINDMNAQAEALVSSGQFDSAGIGARREAINARMERKLLVASDDYGRDLTGVQNLLKKHKRLDAELASHEPAIQAVQDAGEKLMDVSNLGVPEIEQRLKALAAAWEELQALAGERGAKLQQSLAYQQFLAKVDEEEAWISEKQQLVVVGECGDSMAAVQGLLKKHEALEAELAARAERVRDLSAEGEKLLAEGNLHSDALSHRIRALQAALVDNSLYLQLLWKADVVESWIADKETHVRSDEFGRDLSTEQLVEAGHEQTAAIVKRHGDVIARWQRLLADSAARKQRLLQLQDQFRQIEELYLTFAKKASAFNSWFENAEEDLTDPVRCNSIEEIRALRDAHAQFQASLSSAQSDFEALAALDEQIKSFNRDVELTKEAQRQEENDKLRKEFAKHANTFHQWLTETRTSMMEGTGSLEQQLATLRQRAGEDRSGRLNHHEFKSCLRALGYDLPMVEEGQPDPEFEEILNVVDPNRDGQVSLQEYMAFMISKETENVHSSEEIENAFRAITAHQDRAYVTKDELYAPYVEQKTERPIPNALDYIDFTRTLFQN